MIFKIATFIKEKIRGEGAGPSKNGLHGFLGLALFVLFFMGLGSYDLSAPDEPRFALVAREMIENGNWTMPHRNEHPYPDKPPLFFWSIAAMSVFTGGEVNAWSARLPSALAATLILILLWCFTRTDEENNPLLAVAVLATSFLFFFQAHMAQIDMLLCCLCTASVMLGFRIIGGHNHHEAGLGLLLGLAILAKGPVGYLIPAGSLAVYIAFSSKIRWKSYPWRALLWGLAPPLLWIAALLLEVLAKGEWDYLNNLLFKQTLTRYLNAWHHHQPFYYFGRVILHDFFPWVFVLLSAIPFSSRARKALSEPQKLAWAIILFTLVFFSLSKGKRNLYILPLYPFAAYLVACHLRSLTKTATIKWTRYWSFLVIGLLLIVVGSSLVLFVFGYLDHLLPAWFNTVPPRAVIMVSGILLLGFGLYLFTELLLLKEGSVVAVVVAAMMVINILLYQVMLPWVSPYRSARIFTREATRIMEAAESRPLVAMVKFRSAYRFYGNNPIVELATEWGEPRGLPGLAAFWKDHPDGWVIIRRPHMDAFLKVNPTRVVEHYSKEVGSGQEMILLTLEERP